MSISTLSPVVPLPTTAIVLSGHGVCEVCKTRTAITSVGYCGRCALVVAEAAARDARDADLHWVNNVTWCTLTVRTASGNSYTVIKRPEFVVLVDAKGRTARGVDVHVIAGRMWLRGADGTTLVRTTEVVSVYVLEN